MPTPHKYQVDDIVWTLSVYPCEDMCKLTVYDVILAHTTRVKVRIVCGDRIVVSRLDGLYNVRTLDASMLFDTKLAAKQALAAWLHGFDNRLALAKQNADRDVEMYLAAAVRAKGESTDGQR